ncbi:MAG: ATP synthase subunit I [Lacunisphaera sp.]|nr:ATP synthase subunit I [Lacunisphaera sp.]
MKSNLLTVILAGAAGMVLGMIFFGGLWWTVRRALVSRRPARWFLGSLLLRMGLAVAGFYFVGGGQWQRLLPCLLGFIVARFVVVRLTSKPEPRHAP